LASATVAEYCRRLQTGMVDGRVEVRTPVPLSILIPTKNRRESLARTVEACLGCGNGVEVEVVVIDDGSTDGTADGTAELLGELARASPDKLRFESVPAGGPARARNLAAERARHDTLLFLGDDIVPAHEDFLRIHALRHAEHPEADF